MGCFIDFCLPTLSLRHAFIEKINLINKPDRKNKYFDWYKA